MNFQSEDLDEHLSLTSLDKKLSQHPIVRVPIWSLQTPDSPRLDGESDTHAQILAESCVKLPPIIVHRSTMRVIDGAHRLRAAALRGENDIAVRFFDGSEADAFVLAVEANIAHGLPLSHADRTAAAARIISSHPQWSDRAIASVTGLAAKTVGAIRRRAAGDGPQLRVRVGRDGRTRPLDASEGRLRASELMRENPTASLRQIAAKAGISQGTARDVRDRLARGEDPVSPQRRRTLTSAKQPKDETLHEGCRPAATVSSIEDRMSLLERLKRDPSLRFTEAGRSLIRLLDIHSLSKHEWNQLLATAPVHCRGAIAELAQACAEMWQEFALQFDQNIRA